MMLSSNDFIQKYSLKNKATANFKSQPVLSSLLLTVTGILLRDGAFHTDIGIVNLHPFQGTHWVFYIRHCYFDS